VVLVAVLSMAGCTPSAQTPSESSPFWRVAVIDGGIEAVSPDRVRSITRWVARDTWLGTATDGHGDLVANVMLDASDAGARRAVERVDLLDVRVATPTTPPTAASISAGIDRAVAARADLVVIALSAPTDTPELRRSVDRATGRGIVVVASLRNELVGSPSFPADHPAVLAVSSVDPSHRRAPTSPRDGDVSAIGVEVPRSGSTARARPVTGTSIAAASAAGAILGCASPQDTRDQIIALARQDGAQDNRNIPVLRCEGRNTQ
jgi:hypothetical protein